MAEETRRSTAAQFFMDEDEGMPAVPTYDRVVDLLNQASLLPKDSQKINNLKQVQELIVHKEPNLMDNFLDEMLAFQSDRSVDIRKFVVNFMEDACKKDSEVLTKILPSLQLMLEDENVNVQKKVILTLPQVFKVVIQWISKVKNVTDERTAVWETMKAIKTKILEMIDSENDGIRTHVVKFLEGLVLVLSRKTADSEIPKTKQDEVNLDSIPDDNKYLKVKRLEEEGKNIFETMLQFQAASHISSINLITVMGSITNIAKQRPEFFGKVVQSFETLQVNLPPTLAKSQVSSVRKNMKMHMLSLLKHSASVDYITQITTLLTDLGATQTEVMKNMPKVDESRKRKAEEVNQTSKKAKVETIIELDDDDGGMTPFVERSKAPAPPTVTAAKKTQTAIDITSEDLVPRLTPQNVADLVLISMVMLPDNMPAQFQSTYTPIAAAGTDGQIKHIARLLATQLTQAGMGKGIAEVQRQTSEEVPVDDGGSSPAYVPATPKQSIQTVVGGQTAAYEQPSTSKIMPAPTLPVRRGIKHFKLSHVTQDLDRDKLDNMTISAVQRILNAEKSAAFGNALQARTKLLVGLVSQFGGELKDVLQEFIFDDLRSRSDLAFAWLYQEYANCQGFCATTLGKEKANLASYDECLTRLLNALLERAEHKEGLFNRLLMEAPAVTDNAIQILKKYCLDENRVAAGMNTLKDLILTRPAHRLRFLDVMLELCSHEKLEVRNAAIRTVKKLYEKPQISEAIESFAARMLQTLLLPKPSTEVFPSLKAKPGELPQTWTEETMKMCLYLYLGLLPINHKLIHELANVYTSASADIKRTILRALETPVKGMGMHSPELLKLVENCPKGAETLVTRVIHILTDKAAPSPDLVERVRDLYQKRVPDVRFLIPVLTGLKKKEVIAALPKLIKLNPIVVKEVFNRLLGGHGDATSYTSPLTPSELLISLHNIDPEKCDMKTIIKATNLCFGEKKIYTQEVLAVVMQTLMEQTPLPTLFMRTVLQSLAMYPRLIGFILNILQRLITKQVWKQKRVWEGFIRCCQKTKPQSFAVLLQLPAPQLKSVFDSCAELREPLLAHVQTFTPEQRIHIPRTIMTVLETDPSEAQKEADAKAQKEKEEKLKQEAELKAKKEQEAIAMIEAEEKARLEAEQKAKKAATEKAMREAQEKEKRRREKEAQDKAKREEEERKRKEEKRQEEEAEKARIAQQKAADIEMLDEDPDSPENKLAIAEEPMDVSLTSANGESQSEDQSVDQDNQGDSSQDSQRRGRSSKSATSTPTRRSSRTKK